MCVCGFYRNENFKLYFLFYSRCSYFEHNCNLSVCLVCSVIQTLRRCYSRVKEHGIGKRKSSYTIEQLEKVFGQGGWDSQSCAPVLINSSGLYQEMESDSSTLEDFSQEDWCNQVLDSAFQEGDMETGEWHSSSKKHQQ